MADSSFQPERFENAEIIELTKSQLLIPGLIDTHVHAPQFAFVGTGLDLPLLQWLEKYTFPCEAKFKDLSFAEKVYRKSTAAHIRNGTTTICYYGTLHLEATKLLADIVEASGIRGFVGKVCMDQNAPAFYIEPTVEQSVNDTRAFIDYLKTKKSTVVPVVTPRFAPACTAELLQSLGKLAVEYDLPVQTHLCENKAEVAWVGKLFPQCISYTDVYEKYGLLGPKSIMAHCVYLTQDEIDVIEKTGTGIAHCPNSNMSLASGIMPARKLFDRGVKMGLGTDLAGGYSSSLFNTIRKTIGASKIYHASLDRQHDPLGLPEAFWLATRGGAELVGLGNEIGVLQQGWAFDALLIDHKDMDCFIEEGDPLS